MRGEGLGEGASVNLRGSNGSFQLPEILIVYTKEVLCY